MRVLQTPVRFHPAIGGVESTVYELSTRLCDRGHEVAVLCADTGAGEKRETVDGIDVLRLSSPVSLANTNITPTLPVQAVRMARWADVVHTHVPTPWSADLSALAGLATGTPVVLTYHNDIVADGPLHRVAQLYNATGLQLTLRLVDRILLTRPGYHEDSSHLAPYSHKTTTVLNGVDVDRFRPDRCAETDTQRLGFDPDRPNLFFLSVLDEYHEYKGLDVLLAAMARLAETDRQPHLVVGGDGSRRTAYEARARDLGVADSVSFLGYVSEDDLPLAYDAADAFVLPSVSSSQEGFGLVALEALACETPVVTTDVVGVASAISRDDLGRVVSPGDEQALANSIERVLADPPDVTAGRRLCVEQYSWSETVDDLLAVYESVREAR